MNLKSRIISVYHMVGLVAFAAIELSPSKIVSASVEGDAAVSEFLGNSRSNKMLKKCRPVGEILCETDVFGSFCDLLKEADLESTLNLEIDNLQFTVFAPTNTALESFEIESLLMSSNNSTTHDDQLASMLMLHILPNEKVKRADLQCDSTFVMANGDETKVTCITNNKNETVVSVIGPGNTNDEDPRIVVADVGACNGVIHIIDGALHPSSDGLSSPSLWTPIPPEEPEHKPMVDCKTVEDIVCEMDDMTIMCGFLRGENAAVGVEDDHTDLWTLFAPTDSGFEYIQDVLDGLEPKTLLDVFQYHTVLGEELYSDQLVCESSLGMGNGQASFTSCSPYSGYTYQEGPGNVTPRQPRIIAFDLPACNGLVHIVNNVMLPDF